jgi:lysophospholipase L1-like esterase
MGSSVSLGIGATGVQGYSFLYDKILKDRYTNNTGLNWKTSNISVSGNSTINVLNRWENDLLNNGSKYVIYGLSLGNEGILGGGQQKFDQFKTNMLMLISKARSAGKVPVLTGNYGRGDFTTVENDFVKKMNLLIQEWDVPSVNLWGSIDDGNGKWAAGYQNGTDVFHPNDAGHAEMSYAFVPSLFDALQAGKTLPTKQTGYSLTLDKDVLVFKPDNKIHSFTVSFDIKTTSSGIVSTFKQGSSIGSIQIDSATGFLSYTSPSGQKTQGSIVINDGAWHKVTLTHFYVRSKTFLYSDSVSVGSVSEQLNATDFYLNSEISKATALYRDWMFYRSGMNELEITALCNGKMLKSSLELYAPLDGTAATYKEKTRNLAQSTNEISVILSNLGVKDSNKFDSKNIMLIPTVISKELRIFGLSTSNSETYQFKIYSIDGKQVYKKEQYNYNESVDVSNLKSGTYLLNLKNSKSSESITLYFIKK